MFRVSTTPIIRSTQNCNCNLRYWSYNLFCAAASHQRGQASLATLEGGSCTKNMTSTGGCSYIFVYSWWWVWLTPETCKVNLQNNKETALCYISLNNYWYFVICVLVCTASRPRRTWPWQFQHCIFCTGCNYCMNTYIEFEVFWMKRSCTIVR